MSELGKERIQAIASGIDGLDEDDQREIHKILIGYMLGKDFAMRRAAEEKLRQDAERATEQKTA